MERRIKIALAGFGMSGQVFHAPFLMADPRYELSLVYERRTEKAKEKYPSLEVTHSWEALLGSDAEIIVLCTPNQTHRSLAEKILEAGKGLVVEKPLCATAREADALIALAEKKGVPLTVYQNRRWDGGYRTAKELVQRGALGEIAEWEGRFDRFSPNPNTKVWKETASPETGLLYDLGSHLIDQAVHLFGAPERVWAQVAVRRTGREVADDFVVHLLYPTMRATLSANLLSALPGPHLRVRGQKGAYEKGTYDGQEALLVAGKQPGGPDWGKESQEDWGELSVLNGEGKLERRRLETLPGNYGLFYDGLYGALVAGKKLPVDPREVQKVLRILELCKESAETGNAVAL